jgi:PhoH-like ATPase
MAKAYGVKGKNAGQDDAIKALLDCSIDLVVLEGVAGSGKTLLALAAGLEHVLESKQYKEIMFTRAPVSVGDDMGFLPGTVDDKLLPWCGALLDNLEYLIGDSKQTESFVTSKLKMMAMQHMRGRSLTNRYLIVDEAQNISTQQMKVILTRAGENTKIIVLGDNSQIDNKRLSVDNNALAFLIKASISEDFIKLISLPEGVRSRLCVWAAKNM